MISLDQVLLLQEKVESAVEKITSLTERITQLESDNDALNRKCLELTKALEEKTEFVSTLESAQGKIEESILMTINRLDSVEDAILGNDAESGDISAEPSETEEDFVETPTPNMVVETSSEEEQPEEPEITIPTASESAQSADEPFVYEQEEPAQESSGLLHRSEQSVSQTMEQPQVFEEAEEETTDTPAPSALDGQFDIF